jgi:hypothetical protein
MDYDSQFDDNEWTPHELAQLRALSAERESSATLKARTVRSLRSRNLIGVRWSPVMRSLFGLAAASLVFAAGAAVGYVAGSRRTTTTEAGASRTAAVARVDSSGEAQRPQMRQVIWF